jgi:hypothetical protein
MLDSHMDFGINGRMQDRVQYGKAAVCTPLPYTENPDFGQVRPVETSVIVPEGFSNITFNNMTPPFWAAANGTGGVQGI